MTFSLTWLPEVLRAAGLKVVEEAGWESRGRGPMGTVKGVICHHTAGPAHATGTPGLSTIIHGRGEPNPLAGPLSQLYLARDGTWHVVAAGRCNHAGAGAWHGVTAGNSSFIGIEAENAGTGLDPWPEAQIASYAQGVAAILIKIGADDVMAAGHKEFALPRGRKIDPSFDMIAFRERVEAYMIADDPIIVKPDTFPVPQVHPSRAMLRKGDQGESVRVLQRQLGIRVDGAFGPKTKAAVEKFQRAHGLTVDGLVGPKTWAALGV